MTTSPNQTIKELEAQAAGKSVVCFILARKKSKRLPHKNKLPLCGKPLVQYAIAAAKGSGIFENVVVSSDDEDILEIAYESKCLVHKRPDGLAVDKVQMKAVIAFLLEVYGTSGTACMMSPCNPFITPDDLKAGYKLFRDKDANYVMSVKQAQPHPNLARRLVNGMIEPPLLPIEVLKRTQSYIPMYFADGGFIFFKTDAFMQEYDYGFYGTKNYPYITPHITVDIDTQAEFDLAQKLMEVK